MDDSRIWEKWARSQTLAKDTRRKKCLWYVVVGGGITRHSRLNRRVLTGPAALWIDKRYKRNILGRRVMWKKTM